MRHICATKIKAVMQGKQPWGVRWLLAVSSVHGKGKHLLSWPPAGRAQLSFPCVCWDLSLAHGGRRGLGSSHNMPAQSCSPCMQWCFKWP